MSNRPNLVGLLALLSMVEGIRERRTADPFETLFGGGPFKPQRDKIEDVPPELAGLVLASKPFEPLDEHGRAQFREIVESLQMLDIANVDSVVVTVLHRVEPGTPCHDCGFVHEGEDTLSIMQGVVATRDVSTLMAKCVQASMDQKEHVGGTMRDVSAKKPERPRYHAEEDTGEEPATALDAVNDRPTAQLITEAQNEEGDQASDRG